MRSLSFSFADVQMTHRNTSRSVSILEKQNFQTVVVYNPIMEQVNTSNSYKAVRNLETVGMVTSMGLDRRYI